MERDLLKTNRGLLGQGTVDTVSRYRCVDAQKAAGFPVAAACQAAGVTRSAYYAWTAGAAQAAAERHREEARLVGEIRRIHARSRGIYGSPRVHAELGRRGWRVNHKRVERLMRAHGIVGWRPRRRRSLTRQDRGMAPAPDLLGRLFDPDRPDVAWCGDVTWIPTDEGWLYLASVLDLASRHLVGYSMGNHHDAALVTDALGAAVATRGRSRMDGTIFHTDRGSEYVSAACIQACQRLGLRRSMGRTGSCLDNAVAEAWFASLKVELVDRATTAPGPRPGPPSSAGSPGTTASGSTLPTTTCHLSSGNSSTPSARYHRPPPHNPGVHLPGEVHSDLRHGEAVTHGTHAVRTRQELWRRGPEGSGSDLCRAVQAQCAARHRWFSRSGP
jgi:putative transposase